MSIYDKASLVLIPSGTKTSKVYSQKPTSGDGDFTFSRSTAATRVNADGVIEKETQNLLLQSNSFDTTWVNFNTSDTGGQSGYDGSSNAWLISNTGASGHIRQTSISASGIQTFSIYAKAGSLNWLKVTSQSGNVKFNVNLSNGTIGTTGNLVIEAKATDIGSGWYRCSMAFNASTTGVYIYPATADEDVSQTSGNIYIQDAQLEQGLVARDVITTTTSAVEGGITDNVPRLDYTDATCPNLLLEPQRSNLMVQSEGFSTSAWTDNKTSNTSVTANAAVSPEGLQNATEIDFTTTGGAEIYDQFSNVASSMHIGSVFLKNNDVNFVQCELTGATPDILAQVTIDLRDGTLSAQAGDYTPTIEDYGNGWWRVAFGDTANASVATPAFKLKSVGSNTGSFYAFGAQVEAGSYATSYIPTYGSAVTRNQDLCYITNLKNDVTTGATEGSVMIDFTREGYNSTGDAIQVYGDSSNGRGYVYNTGVGFASDWGFSFSSITYGNDYKILYQLNTLSTGNIFLNGSKSSDASGTSWGSINAIYLRGNYGTLKIRQVLVLTTALSDADAIDLTT